MILFRNVRFSVLVVLVLLLAMPTFAQDSDTATLNLSGTVPSLVRIGFNSTANDSLAHDFDDLTAPVQLSTTLTYLANVDFAISVASENSGSLLLDGASDGFLDSVGYTFTFDGGVIDLAGGSADLITAGTRGIASVDMVFAVEPPVSLDGFTSDDEVADIPAAGEYLDTVTFTITANE